MYISEDVIRNEEAVESSQVFQSQRTVVTDDHFIASEKNSVGMFESIEENLMEIGS